MTRRAPLGVLVIVLAMMAAMRPSGQTPASKSAFGPPPTDSWPSYNGDTSGRRFSTLDKVNASNVQNLSLAWMYRANTGSPGGGATIKGTPVQVNGVLYLTVPDHVWAVDARTGRELWHFG